MFLLAGGGIFWSLSRALEHKEVTLKGFAGLSTLHGSVRGLPTARTYLPACVGDSVTSLWAKSVFLVALHFFLSVLVQTEHYL